MSHFAMQAGEGSSPWQLCRVHLCCILEPEGLKPRTDLRCVERNFLLKIGWLFQLANLGSFVVSATLKKARGLQFDPEDCP